MEEPNILNIPAYQRKKSIMRQEKRSNTYANNKPKTPRKRTSKTKTNLEQILTDIQSRSTLPSEKLFPDSHKTTSRKHAEVREMKECGICEGYFEKIDVAIIKLTSPLRTGDRIIFEKNKGLFEQEVNSMQINRKDVSLAKTGSDIGLKVTLKPNVGTPVYKVI